MKDSDEYDVGGSSPCQFLIGFPLYGLLDLSRVDKLPLWLTTEHLTYVSTACRHGDAYSQALQAHSKWHNDIKVFQDIKRAYLSVAK